MFYIWAAAKAAKYECDVKQLNGALIVMRPREYESNLA